MEKIILLLCLTAGADKGFLGIPKADVIGIDLVSAYAGAATLPIEVSPKFEPSFLGLGVGASALRVQAYWRGEAKAENRAGFLLGLESGSAALLTGYLPWFDLLLPKVGFVYLGKSRSSLPSSCLLPSGSILKTMQFAPRVELSSGVTLLNPVMFLTGEIAPMVKTGLRWLPSRLFFIQLQHYWIPGEEFSSVFLSAGLTLGIDDVRLGRRRILIRGPHKIMK
ncbi:MAG: hypothetical protein E3J71_04120 [Candidatus Stahlbacteria bacterium]|nr:MAG: hypothetical protein E3J71_04120 [Candidatus Stahlbacteria bacterium]